MNAFVTEKVYTNRGHTISEDEIAQVNRLIFDVILNRQVRISDTS